MVEQTESSARIKLPRINLRTIDWSYVSIRLLAAAAAVFVLTWRLSSLTYHRLSLPELVTLRASNSWHVMLTNPIFLPYKALEWAILHLGGAGHIYAVRLATIIFALITLWLFLSITRRWFNRPTYVLATVLFGASLWLLHFGRLAVPAILYVLAPLAIIRLAVWIRNLKKGQAASYRLVIALPVIFALTLYVPGMWLLWLVVIIWQYRKLALLAKKLPWPRTLGIIGLALLLLVPLAYGLARDPSLLVTNWLGVHRADILSLERLELFYKLPLHYLAYGPLAPASQWLARQPILDAFSAAMALAGLGFYIWQHKLRQAKLLLIMLVAGLVLYVVSDGTIDIWAGLVYLLVAVGIGYLLQIWRKVFPRNPVAYGGAILLLAAVTALAVFYTTKSYFVAWHYHPETSRVFSIRL